MRFVILVFSLFALAGCTASPPPQTVALTPPIPPDTAEPGDAALKRAIARYLSRHGDPAASRYEYTRVDLDQDGRRDALVMMKTPYGHWCGEYGCSLLVFAARGASFEVVNKVHPVRPPLYVSPAAGDGWRDLIVHISGRPAPEKAKNVVLRFDGAQYPAIPDVLPAYIQLSKNENTKIFP